MKRYLYCILFLMIFWGSVWADEASCAVDSCARYELLDYHIYDFGDVDIHCDSISAVFSVKSTGNTPMLILDGSTTCTCTDVAFSKDIVPTGDTVEIVVTYHPFVLGSFKQSAVVKTNTKPYSHFWLYVMGNVVESKPKDDLQDGED